jgi:hypothetical protein
MDESIEPAVRRERVAPIFILADDDREAVGRLVPWLPRDWYYIPVADPEMVVKYALEFTTTAIFLSDRMDSPTNNVPRLLQSLLDDVGKPVVILSEICHPEVVEHWKRMGAQDCLPHPTRTEARVGLMREKMNELVRAALEAEKQNTGMKEDG